MTRPVEGQMRRIFEIVRGHEAEQSSAKLHRLLVVLGDQVHHAGFVHLRLRAAKLLRGDVFARDLLDDLRSGDEHPRLAGLDDEVGERRAVSRAAGAGAADQRDLRHRPREHHVVIENAAICRPGCRCLPARARRRSR